MKKIITTILIIVIFLGVYIFYGLINSTSKDPQFIAQLDIRQLESGLSLFKLDNGFFPTTEQGLNALIIKPSVAPLPKKWREIGYIPDRNLLTDPWGNSYLYTRATEIDVYVIISLGADGRVGGGGYSKDIYSWNLN